MSTPTPPFLRRRLGRRLKALRESAGLGLAEAAKRLDKARSSLHRIETGETRADVHLIRSMMDLYDRYEEDLLDQAREARRPTWYSKLGVTPGYVDLETLCCRVSEFGGLTVPGLLQAEPYIRAIRAASRRPPTAHQIDTMVTVRQIRQRRLTSRDNPLELFAVVAEGVLRREVGGPDLMHYQLRHMVETAALPNVTLQVLPSRRGAFCTMDGSFVLLDFPEPGDPELLFIEYITGALRIDDAEEVREARLKFDQLRTEALSPSDSISLIEQIASELGR